jgi:hypothetical protein
VGAVVAGAHFGEIPDEWECQREASGISPTARINDDPADRSPTPGCSYPYSSIA